MVLQAAFYWETPPTTLATAAATPFTFVTKAAHTLARAEPDAGPFAAQLKECAGLAEARIVVHVQVVQSVQRK